MQEDLITTNIKKINDALKECSYIIDRYTAMEKTGTNPKTNRQVTLDYKVTVYPTNKVRLCEARTTI